MNQKLKIPCRILDKRKTNGFLWDSFYVTLRILTNHDHSDSPLAKVGCAVNEIAVSREQYYDMDIGTVYLVMFYIHSDKRLYLIPES